MLAVFHIATITQDKGIKINAIKTYYHISHTSHIHTITHITKQLSVYARLSVQPETSEIILFSN